MSEFMTGVFRRAHPEARRLSPRATAPPSYSLIADNKENLEARHGARI